MGKKEIHKTRLFSHEGGVGSQTYWSKSEKDIDGLVARSLARGKTPDAISP